MKTARCNKRKKIGKLLWLDRYENCLGSLMPVSYSDKKPIMYVCSSCENLVGLFSTGDSELIEKIKKMTVLKSK